MFTTVFKSDKKNIAAVNANGLYEIPKSGKARDDQRKVGMQVIEILKNRYEK